MKTVQTTHPGATTAIVGPVRNTYTAKDYIDIKSLIINNTDTTSIGVKVYLWNGSTNYYILGSTSTFFKMGVGYSADIFEKTPFSYDGTYELKIYTDSGHTATSFLNYEIRRSFDT